MPMPCLVVFAAVEIISKNYATRIRNQLRFIVDVISQYNENVDKSLEKSSTFLAYINVFVC